MVYCAVVRCKSRTYTTAEKEKAKQRNQDLTNFRFFKIPKVRVHECGKTRQLSERRQREWIARLNRKGVANNPHKYKVCCRHFISVFRRFSSERCRMHAPEGGLAATEGAALVTAARAASAAASGGAGLVAAAATRGAALDTILKKHGTE
ncbi:hypothetical protein MTO96_044889 [Rhipicephalus appendiculatus]